MRHQTIEPFAVGQAFALAPTHEPVARLNPDSHRELMNGVFGAPLPLDRHIRRLSGDESMAVTQVIELRDFLLPLPWPTVSHDVIEPETRITHAALLFSCWIFLMTATTSAARSSAFLMAAS